jgi:hypothetical protein
MAAAPASSPNWTSGATVITLRRHRLSRARTRRAGTRASGTPWRPSWRFVAGTQLLPWLGDRWPADLVETLIPVHATPHG